MNNFDEWTGAAQTIRKAIAAFEPHFEILESPDTNDSIIMFFAAKDTGEEWNLFNSIPEEYSEEFAEDMQIAKETLLEAIGFNPDYYDTVEITERAIAGLNDGIRKRIAAYEGRTGQDTKELFMNMLIYSEWLQLPENVMEQRYEDEVNRQE